MREWFKVQAAAHGGGEILIYDVIGKRWWDEDAVSAKGFNAELKALVDAGPGDIHVRISSPGGDVGDGMAIYNALRGVKDRVVCTVDSIAYSMASVIALAGRTTRMADTGQFMVHNPLTGAYGDEKTLEAALGALRVAKATLIKAYQTKTGKSDEEIAAAMEKTTFMTADEAKEFGFVDEVMDGAETLSGVAANFDATAWANWYQGAGPVPFTRPAPNAIPAAAVPAAVDEAVGDETPETGGIPEKDASMSLKSNDIREACPGASAEFVLSQVEASEANESYQLLDAVKAFAAEQAKALEAERTARAEAEAKAEAPQKPARGVAALGAGEGGDDETTVDPIANWHTAVAAKVAQGMDKTRAVRAVCVESPEIREAYVAAYNAKHKGA